ncbi:MAG: hypothetical protein RJB39_212 [Candidatus Parcubacteria bacterium]|jgi:hypothetical protein
MNTFALSLSEIVDNSGYLVTAAIIGLLAVIIICLIVYRCGREDGLRAYAGQVITPLLAQKYFLGQTFAVDSGAGYECCLIFKSLDRNPRRYVGSQPFTSTPGKMYCFDLEGHIIEWFPVDGQKL